MEKITPKVDIAFKKIFGVEENKDLLISLINSIVSDEDQVTKITLLNPYNNKNFKNDKLSILDIKASGETGKKFNIEIQLSHESDYEKRALYYWSKLYSEQMQSGHRYYNLRKTIAIHILNFNSIYENDRYHNIFCIKEKDDNFEYCKDLELHIIELQKFSGGEDLEISTLLTKVKTKLDMWLAFLTQNDLLYNDRDNLLANFHDQKLCKAVDILNIMNFTNEEREFYESHLKWIRMEHSALRKAELDGEAIGMEKGIKEGIKEGMEKGIKKEKIETAKNLFKLGMDIDVIKSVTCLSDKEIKEITNIS